MANTKPVTVRIERRLLSLAALGLGLAESATDSQIIRAALIFASGLEESPDGIVTRANKTRSYVDRNSGRIVVANRGEGVMDS